ncbi:MAG: tetratricopeptide repeat protein, partial [Chloroflexi bacterium]|nr:tetratricopeptide repeat protein [Chloroflexota bacterium]
YPGAAVYVSDLRLIVREQIRWLEQAVNAARKLGNKGSEGNHLGNLGLAYAALGEVRQAIGFYEQHLAIAREIGDRRGEGNALANMGLAYKELDDMDRAKELWRAALVIYEALEDPNVERVRGWLKALEHE